MKKISKLLLVAIMVATICLVGCGADKEQPEVLPTEAPVAAPAEESASPDGAPTGSDNEEIPQTPLEDIGGEGAVDDTMPDIVGLNESPIGEPVMFAGPAGEDLCLFAIESIESLDMAIENMGDVTGKKVVVVSYSYTNKASKDGILLDDMSFKMIANDIVATPYFAPSLTPAEMSGIGETASGQVAFLVDEESKDVILVLENIHIGVKAMFKATI